MTHLKWGILGSGSIARTFARGLQTTEEATCLAVASRSFERARAFAVEMKLDRAYGSYDELLADPDVDAVYISLPNHMHADWSVKCAQAGKHILCEKPVTVNAGELEHVLTAVRAHDVFFMEAFMYRCHPQWPRVRELLDAGRIGEIRALEASFAFNMGPNYADIRMQNETAGGALMDVGCYCVSFARLIAGEEPTEAHAVARIGERSRVDEVTTGVLRFPSGVVAHFACALQCAMPIAARIFGDRGSLEITAPWFPSDENATIVVTTGQQSETIEVRYGRNLYANEALTVAEHLDGRQAPAMNWADSLGQMQTLDALRRSMGLRFGSEQ